jgi:hypothetical protein
MSEEKTPCTCPDCDLYDCDCTKTGDHDGCLCGKCK